MTGALAETQFPLKTTENNQYMCSVSLLCAETFAVFMFQFDVMSFVVCPCEHVGDLSHLCLLRAKFKDCFFFLRNIISLIFIRVAAVGHLVPVRVHGFHSGGFTVFNRH